MITLLILTNFVDPLSESTGKKDKKGKTGLPFPFLSFFPVLFAEISAARIITIPACLSTKSVRISYFTARFFSLVPCS
ncbi:Uncharacterized protein dnm_001940 [Desulfonema magnum]|uniref:Uncharacterized protein n=1 Tax=Desulfonema magnum TaxID=45655 RepID=A0A975BF79_9BACT|nr:Uncharacterized protein dnm_001940 [Desulfonema magnum]